MKYLNKPRPGDFPALRPIFTESESHMCQQSWAVKMTPDPNVNFPSSTLLSQSHIR